MTVGFAIARALTLSALLSRRQSADAPSTALSAFFVMPGLSRHPRFRMSCGVGTCGTVDAGTSPA